MATLLEIRNAQKTYGHQVLLDGASAVLDESEKVGLIGRNGTGKSTLVRIIAEEEELDHGEIQRHPRLRLGYLRQHDPFLPGETVREFLQRDTGRPEWRCGEVAAQFELKNERFDAPLESLSGGWRSRVKLAALLLQDPTLLLLDEPTNFLDLRTQLLLERFLRGFRGACLIVSHDRGFLRAVCNQTWELSRGLLASYPGTVDAHFEQKRQRQEIAERTNETIRAKQKQLQTFIDRNRAGANTASQARNKQKQLDRLELIEIDAAETQVIMRLPDVEARKGPALEVSDLAIGYPERTVARGIRFDIEHGQRLAIVGDNGQGKTTFLRTLCESLPALRGSFRWGFGVEIGVYAQHVYLSLPQDQTVLEYLTHRGGARTTSQRVLDVAGGFLFHGPDVQKAIRVLSGGERARLVLAGLFLGQHNVLILDEPANHLDVETVDAFAEALCSFAGTVLFTSHDRGFVERVATQVAEVRDERLALVPGGYVTYCERVRREIEENATEAGAAANASPAAKPEVTKEAGRLRHEMQKKTNTLERKIEKLDAELAVLLDKMHGVAHDWQEAARLQADHDRLKAEKDGLEEEWLELQGKLEGLTAQ